MGKDGDASEKNSDEENSDSKEETTEEETKEEPEEKPAEAKDKSAEALRKVIKVGSEEGKDKKTEEKEEEEAPADDTGGSSSRESLEQKRAILQSIKDFDFQIKKNQEEIGGVNKKLDGMTKDLDDLVSLYEIVSEQMNPFVGLSKVTKKRLDALENFTREIDVLKERTGELESFAERSGAKIKNIAEGKAQAQTIDTDALLGKEGEEGEGEISADGEGELPTGDTETSESETDKVETDTTDEVVGEDSVPTETEVPTEELAKEVIEPTGEITQEEPAAKEQYIMETQHYIPVENSNFGGLSDSELDIILENAFGVLSPEGKVDMLIDEFIESLKG